MFQKIFCHKSYEYLPTTPSSSVSDHFADEKFLISGLSRIIKYYSKKVE